jgi:hypothetical protein
MDPGDEPQLISSAFILGLTSPVGQAPAAYKTQTGFFKPRPLGKGEATLDIAVYSSKCDGERSISRLDR